MFMVIGYNHQMKSQNEILIILGDIIKDYRENKAITQEELSFKCDVHRNRISLIELGQVNITFTTLLKLMYHLNIPATKIDEVLNTPNLIKLLYPKK